MTNFEALQNGEIKKQWNSVEQVGQELDFKETNRKVYKLVTMENSYLNKYLKACGRESKVYVSFSCGLIICKIVTTAKPIHDHKFWHYKYQNWSTVQEALQTWFREGIKFGHILSIALGTT